MSDYQKEGMIPIIDQSREIRPSCYALQEGGRKTKPNKMPLPKKVESK